MSIKSSVSPIPHNTCVLFSDICGSTQLYETFGNEAAVSVVRRCIRHMDDATRLCKGSTIETTGDGILAIFPTADLCAEAAIDMRSRVANEQLEDGRYLTLRIGFHYGPVLMSDDQLFDKGVRVHGDTVNTASRILGLAKSKQVLTSLSTLHLLSPRWQQSSRVLDSFTLKGKKLDIQIAEILCEPTNMTTMMRVTQSSPPSEHVKELVLRYCGKTYRLDTSVRSITMGREQNNSIVIDDPRVSREHLRIERRRQRFFLVDLSTNGTYITFLEGREEIFVHREELLLHEGGYLSLGQSYFSAEPQTIVEFTLSS